MFAHYPHSVWILFVCIVVVAFGQFWKDVPRKYVVKEDFFKGLKAAEFSIMDEDEQQLLYRIESNFHILHRIEIFRYPEQKKTSHLGAIIHIGFYRANFSILDEKKNRWIEGNIDQRVGHWKKLFVVQWNGNQFNLTNERGDPTYHFRGNNNTLLADFSLRWYSGYWRNLYSLKIYTNQYPDEIYFLALAVADRCLSSKHRG